MANPNNAIAHSEIARFGSRLESPGRVWLVYNSRVFLESRTPQLWALITSRFDEVARFEGTLGDGAVVVCRSR